MGMKFRKPLSPNTRNTRPSAKRAMVAAVFMTALPSSSHSGDCTMRGRFGVHLWQAAFQELAVKDPENFLKIPRQARPRGARFSGTCQKAGSSGVHHPEGTDPNDRAHSGPQLRLLAPTEGPESSGRFRVGCLTRMRLQ